MKFINKYNILRNKANKMSIILLSGLDDHGLMLTNVLDVTPPSVSGIFRSGPSGTLQHCGGEGERSLTPTSPMLSSLESNSFLLSHRSVEECRKNHS